MKKPDLFKRCFKGQAAVEYMMIFGLALVLSTPFIVKAQGAILDLRTSSSLMDARNSADRIDRAAKTVNAAGPPAKRSFTIKLPQGLQKSYVLNEGFIFTVRTSEGTSNITRTFDFKIQGNLPDEEGAHIIAVSAKSDNVLIEETS